ncbi:hypothetical protein ABLO16_11225, partial [Mycobacterium tuberculosis]
FVRWSGCLASIKKESKVFSHLSWKRFRVFRAPRCDVDTPADLTAARQLGVGPATARAVAHR